MWLSVSLVDPVPSPKSHDQLTMVALTAVEALKDAGAIVVGVAVIVERGAEPKIKEAGLEYRAAFQLADLGL